jgi:hypothetical protein
MISPGFICARPRSQIRRRTLSYTRARRERARRTGARRVRVDNGGMLFDQARELPIATVLRAPRTGMARAIGDLSRWFAERWTWLRPRTLPVLVAVVGMFAVLNAVNYLARPPATAIELSDQPNTDVQPTYGFHVKLVLQQ